MKISIFVLMEKQIRVILIDDEPAATASLELLLNTHPEVRIVSIINDPAEAVDAILDLNPDLIFLDIQMPGKTGFEIVKDLQDAGFSPGIIFVTGFDSYAIEAIRHAALDFLVKPVDPVELEQALERLASRPSESDQLEKISKLLEKNHLVQRIKISTAGGFTLINPAEILYVQADWNYAEIFFSHDKSELASMNLGAIEEMLPAGQFFRISRSVIINVAYLSKVSRRKHEALLVRDGREYRFPIPLLNIRKLEKFLE